jgi:peptide/nickel transport system substrate-binding protein
VAGGEMTIAIPVNVDSLDPLKQTTSEMIRALSLVFEGVLSYDSTNRLSPALGESWEPDETGKIWTIHLRQGVKWHGTEMYFSANDVVYTLNHLAELTDSPYYALMQYVESYSAVDLNTIQIEGKEAGEQALHVLTIPMMSQDNAAVTLPVGTGPYRITSASGSGMELEANQNWWKVSPYIEKIHCVGKLTADAALVAISANQLNFLLTSALSARQYREDDVRTVEDVNTQTVETLLINYASDSNFADKNVRKALAYALDRHDLISNVYQNHAVAADVPVPIDSYIYDSAYKVYDTNTDKALQYMSDAGWVDNDNDGKLEKDGREFTCKLLVNDTTDSPARKDAANAIAVQLAEIGVSVEVETAKYAPDAEEPVLDYQTKLENGEFDLALVGFKLNMSGDLSFLLHSDAAKNYGGYSYVLMDNAVEAARTAVGEANVRAAYSELERLFVDELPFITLYFRTASLIYSSDIKGITGMRGETVFSTVNKWYIESAE